MTPAHCVVSIRNAKKEIVNVYPISTVIHTQVVDQNVFLTPIVLVTELAFRVNVEMYVREIVLRVPFARPSITFRCVAAQKAWKETRLYNADQFNVCTMLSFKVIYAFNEFPRF